MQALYTGYAGLRLRKVADHGLGLSGVVEMHDKELTRKSPNLLDRRTPGQKSASGRLGTVNGLIAINPRIRQSGSWPSLCQ